MAEPFGIASLSIEACKALISYCDGWRAFDTEIDSVKMKAEGLLSTLQVLDKLLGETSAVRPIITADIALKMSQTGSRIAAVCQKVTKCSVLPDGSGVDQRLRKTAQKAKYPFRRDTLKSAANDLQDIQINLNTALLALQIQQAQSLRKVEVQGASIITTVDQLQSSLDKMQVVVQGHSIPSDSQLQIASKYPAQCRRASHKYRNNETTKRVRFVSGWLRMSIELMMTIENGTQGFVLSPTLRFRGIVPETSPAFNLIGNLSCGYSTPQQNEEISNRVIRSLQQMFDEGRARPGDQTQNGNTLMTTVSLQIICSLMSSSYAGFLPYYPILRYLVDAGCPIENGWYFQNFFRHIVFGLLYHHGRNISNFVMKLTGIGFQITDKDLSGVDVGACRYAFIHSEESFMISDVTRAILSRSETELIRLIASGKVSSDDHRLCHMCSSWAPGLGILLEFMPAVDPYELALLLETAVKHGCLDSVQILIDHGSPIANSTVWVCDSKETKGIVFDAFIARRKQLLQLARTMLPEYSQEELRLERGLLPDSNAGEIHTQLTRYNIFEPSFLRPYDCGWDRDVSVFHGLTLSVDDMVLLYTAGFHDIDALNSEGYTPISRANLEFMSKQSIGEYIERLKWFMSKGAKLHSPPTITGSVPSHHISRNMTSFLLRPLQAALKTTLESPQCIWLKSLGTHHRDFIGLVYGSGHTDKCFCSCSAAGCTPISMALRVIFFGLWRSIGHFHYSAKNRGFIFSQFILEIPSFAAAAHEVLRFITFTDLGLTHTCCEFDYDRDGIKDFPFDEEEAVEIQDEEKHLLIDFEGLHEEIIREYDQLGIPLLEYIHTHWCRRVREYLWDNGEKVESHSLCNRLDPDFARQWDENKTYKPPKTTSSIPA